MKTVVKHSQLRHIVPVYSAVYELEQTDVHGLFYGELQKPVRKYERTVEDVKRKRLLRDRARYPKKLPKQAYLKALTLVSLRPTVKPVLDEIQ